MHEAFTVPVFIFFSAIANHFKYCQNAPFTVLAFIVFSAVPNRVKCRLECTIYHPCFFKEATLFLTFPLV